MEPIPRTNGELGRELFLKRKHHYSPNGDAVRRYLAAIGGTVSEHCFRFFHGEGRDERNIHQRILAQFMMWWGGHAICK